MTASPPIDVDLDDCMLRFNEQDKRELSDEELWHRLRLLTVQMGGRFVDPDRGE
ncbi:MAG: hypothetical protein AAGC44_05180 [Planctomycetota bacterium]